MTGKTLTAVAVLIGTVWLSSPRAAEDGDGRAGWLATFTSADGKALDRRVDRFVALHVPAGTAAMPGLPPGPFRAEWRGDLSVELKTVASFRTVGTGRATVSVNGAVVADGKSVALKRGANAVVVAFVSPDKGDASLRLLWQSDEFPPEPVPLTLVRHVPTKASETAERLRLGREVAAERRCFACHKADVAGWLKAGGMPELEMDAPALKDINARLRPGWVARWLQDPSALRPSHRMPRPFADAERGDDAKLDPRVRDLAAYLATLGTPPEELLPPREAAVEAGLRLYARLGCVACHLAPDRDEKKDDLGRLPLRDVSAKWRTDALVAFLRQPDRHYAWVRMPNFHLTEAEAASLAAYLRSVKPRDAFDAEAGDAVRGKKLVETAGCVQCHVVGERTAVEPHPTAPPWVKLKAATCKGPDFGLSDEHADAVAALLAADPTSPGRDTPAEFAARQVVTMRCQACHQRDGAEDWWTQLKEESDGLTADLEMTADDKDPKYSTTQARPTLTWAGEKLKPEWTAALLGGTLSYKPRPFLRARMPAFPRRAELLAVGLAAGHGCPPKSPPDAAPDAVLAEAGRAMTGKAKWGCVGCHTVGSAAAVGVFEAPGVNFDLVRERLRRDYFDRWMWAPQRVEPGTKMPTVFQYRKPSLLADVLGGSAEKQVDAFWSYLMTGKRIKHPPE